MGLLLHVCALNDNCVRLLWGDDLCARAPVGAFAATAARRDRPGGRSSARAEIRQPYRALSARWQVFEAQTPYKAQKRPDSRTGGICHGDGGARLGTLNPSMLAGRRQWNDGFWHQKLPK